MTFESLCGCSRSCLLRGCGVVFLAGATALSSIGKAKPDWDSLTWHDFAFAAVQAVMAMLAFLDQSLSGDGPKTPALPHTLGDSK